MKSNLIILTILISALFGCRKTNEVIISGKITGIIPDKVFYSVPINGVSYGGFKESVKPDSLGNFQIKILAKEPAFTILMIPKIDPKILLIEPGDNFNISINTGNESKSFKISGANELGQNLYNTLPNPSFVQQEARKFANNSSLDSIKRKILALKTDDISRFKELLNKKEISKTFFNMLSADRDCYYAVMTATIPLLNFYKTDPEHLDKFPIEMKKMWENVYLEFPLNQKNFLYSSWWYEYTKTYIIYKEFFSESFKVQNLREFYEKGLIHTHNLGESKKYLTGTELEYYEAAYIYIESLQKKYEKEFIPIFDQFKTDFPNSKYIKYLEPMINPIIEYHKIVDTGFDESVKFIDNYEKIGSLKEAVESLKGRKIYVDVWATWCGPCKKEFEYVVKLKELLKSKDTEILYISIDKPENDKQWKEMIKFYKLSGKHIRANENLNADLIKIFKQNGSISIPWYILIDENGNIIKEHAKRPSELAELEVELTKN